MEIKETIEVLKNMINLESAKFTFPQIDMDVAVMRRHIEALQLAISALEKQEGKKPIRVNKNDDFDGNFEVTCPVCGKKLMERITTNEMSFPRIYNMTDYCWCGQKLDWTE